ncbi:lasso peptide biosynthesis B2 protein [Actinoplanes missouriensis]|uniref:lasso peptide biosynthesis B2 protein n=1 Tax=Actinoplanes missouriensis TaxID=1866 RepID=UPI00340FD012
MSTSARAVVPLRRRMLAKVVVGVARVLATRSPDRICRTLRRLRGGARPATFEEASAARRAVVRVSPYCGGPLGCLPRSIATALLCRLGGSWPTWQVGPRLHPPFGAHAWVEVDGKAVDEPYPDGFHVPMLTV